jgi:hypothetical protein
MRLIYETKLELHYVPVASLAEAVKIIKAVDGELGCVFLMADALGVGWYLSHRYSRRWVALSPSFASCLYDAWAAHQEEFAAIDPLALEIKYVEPED